MGLVSATLGKQRLAAQPASRLAESTSQVPFSPNQIQGMLLWYAADRGTYIAAGGAEAIANGAAVGQWRDFSGQHNHASAGAAPSLAGSARNGKPVVRWTSAGTHNLLLATTQTLTVFTYLAACVMTSTRMVVLGGGNFGGADAKTLFGPGITNTAYMRNDDDGTGLDATFTGIASWHVYSATADSSGGRSFIDGVFYKLSTVTFNTAIIRAVGGRHFTTDQYSDGDTGEIMLFNRVLGDGERRKCEKWLQRRWDTP